jgi:uncharacterized protein DUF3455
MVNTQDAPNLPNSPASRPRATSCIQKQNLTERSYRRWYRRHHTTISGIGRMRNYFINTVGGRRAILFGAVAFAAVALGLPSAESQTQPSAPDSLKPPAGEHLRAHAHASGQQIYTCDGSKWILSGPDAKLFDAAGQKVGSHFAGPTWQWSDGSRVTAKPVASATRDPESIPWLLLTATGHTGDGVMKNVSTIQRLQTKGGKSPANGCEESNKSAQSRVSYTADYYFYVR